MEGIARRWLQSPHSARTAMVMATLSALLGACASVPAGAPRPRHSSQPRLPLAYLNLAISNGVPGGEPRRRRVYMHP